MFSKLYEKVKEYIKENYKFIIFLVALAIIMNIPVNYSILSSGGTIDIDDRVIIENSYKSKGSLNLAYVTELRGNVISYLFSYIIPDWERVPLDDYKANDKETKKDINERGYLSLKESEQASVKVAYLAAGKDIKILNSNFYVYYVADYFDYDLNVGDEILKIDDIPLTSTDDIAEVLNNKSYGDYVKLTIKEDSKEKELNVKIHNDNNEKKLGISVAKLYDYETYPKLKFNFKSSESGPSGGLMLTLAIYNKLTDFDITKGKKIVGTGTIDEDGNVGSIDGVKYKLKGAVKAKADIFIAPNGKNYEECIKLKEEKNYKIDIIGVSTFYEALDKLDSIN